MKFLIFSSLDTDSESRSGPTDLIESGSGPTDPIESGSNSDMDPKQRQEQFKKLNLPAVLCGHLILCPSPDIPGGWMPVTHLCMYSTFERHMNYAFCLSKWGFPFTSNQFILNLLNSQLSETIKLLSLRYFSEVSIVFWLLSDFLQLFQIRIHMILGLPDPHLNLLDRSTDLRIRICIWTRTKMSQTLPFIF